MQAAVAFGEFDAALALSAASAGTIEWAKAVDAEHKRRTRSYFLRADLMFPTHSPYWKVVEAGNEGAYWQLLRTDRATFERICEHVEAAAVHWRDGFVREYARDANGDFLEDEDGNPVMRLKRRRGRPNMLDARGVIALTLAWLGSSGPNNRLLEQIFGIGHSVEDRDILEGLDLLISALLQIPDALVRWPNLAKMIEFDRMFQAAHGINPFAPYARFFCITDNLRTTVQRSNLPDEELLDYNRWYRDTNRNNNITVAPNGKIIHASLNYRGKTHDFTTAAPLFEILQGPLTPPGFAAFGDSAFVSHQTRRVIADRYNYQPPPEAVSDDPVERREQFRMYRRLQRKARQSVEHVYRTLQSTWARMKTRLPCEGEMYMKVMRAAILMHNLNSTGGHNQTHTMYMEAYLRPDREEVM